MIKLIHMWYRDWFQTFTHEYDVDSSIEMQFVRAEFPVFSNAQNHRMNDLVPLVVPLVNPNHLEIIKEQRRQWHLERGFLVCNANCSTTGLVVALKPLIDQFGLQACHVVTLQALSGAGYPGVPSLDSLDNVIPYIGGEEEKIEIEPRKILGQLNLSQTSHQFQNDLKLSAQCNRVAVLDGHLECISVKFTKQQPVTIDETIHLLESYRSEIDDLNLPSAPKRPIHVLTQVDRPQPRLDRDREHGFAISIGRVRECPIHHIRFVLLVHNTLLGAAGSTLLNAELALAKGWLIRRSQES
jgi:aspartate-semialdehyde dehydrogenase